jgi:ketosteroid isomerase-like protein
VSRQAATTISTWTLTRERGPHEYDEILEGTLPNVRHRFSGEHALGGERNDAANLRLWFERLHRLLPNLELTVTDVWVKGGLSTAVVIVCWNSAATLHDGGPYINHGVHVINLCHRKVASIDVSEDSQAVAAGLERQARAGLSEALAAPIVS